VHIGQCVWQQIGNLHQLLPIETPTFFDNQNIKYILTFISISYIPLDQSNTMTSIGPAFFINTPNCNYSSREQQGFCQVPDAPKPALRRVHEKARISLAPGGKVANESKALMLPSLDACPKKPTLRFKPQAESFDDFDIYDDQVQVSEPPANFPKKIEMHKTMSRFVEVYPLPVPSTSFYALRLVGQEAEDMLC
jgi:hypothetical protein